MKKAVFLDRDGTINVDRGYVHTPDEFEFLPGVLEGLKLLKENGFLLIVTTNQSGIGRGFFSEQEYQEFQNWLDGEFDRQGVHIDGWYFCPHVDEDNCDCRKPKTGLFERAAEDFDIDWKASFAIGDKMRDLAICYAKKMRGYLISEDANGIIPGNVRMVASLQEAAEEIVRIEV